jgi:VWFA-related protein
MKRVLIAGVALIAAAATAGRTSIRAQQPPQQTPVFRAEGDAVIVNVSVRGGNQPVSGLKAADFELRDSGVKQSIQEFSIERQPIDVTLLLDVSRSVEGPRLEQLKSSVVETSQLLRREDRLQLIAVQHWLHLIFPFQSGGSRASVDALTAAGGTALYDGIAAGMMVPPERDRRRLIIAYTDGQDTISALSLGALEDLSGFSDAVLQLVVPTLRGGASRSDSASGPPAVGRIATRTGGQLFLMNNAGRITDTFKQAIDDFRTSYVLKYFPAGVAHGGWHELDVKVASGKYDVRARKGYGG